VQHHRRIAASPNLPFGLRAAFSGAGWRHFKISQALRYDNQLSTFEGQQPEHAISCGVLIRRYL